MTVLKEQAQNSKRAANVRALVKTSFVMLKRTRLFTLPILAISTSLHGRGLGTYSTFSRSAFVTGTSAQAAPPTNSLGVQARVASGQTCPGARLQAKCVLLEPGPEL
jgi:hypothetical protein